MRLHPCLTPFALAALLSFPCPTLCVSLSLSCGEFAFVSLGIEPQVGCSLARLSFGTGILSPSLCPEVACDRRQRKTSIVTRHLSLSFVGANIEVQPSQFKFEFLFRGKS